MSGSLRPFSVGALDAAPDTLAALDAAGMAVTGVAAGDGAAAEAVAALAAHASVIVIGGPPGERAAAARAAVDAGAHAFLAWPPGVSADEASRLVARADEAGVEVGVARPLPVSGLLASRPSGWTARLTTLALDASPGGALSHVPAAHRLAGALDLCATLAGSHDPSRLDAAQEGPLVAVAVRFRTGAYAHLAVRDEAPAERMALYASGPGATVEARALGGPLCVEGTTPVAFEPAHEAVAFVQAVQAGRRAPFSLDHALATMRLTERVLARLR